MIEMIAILASSIKDLLHWDITAIDKKCIFIQTMKQSPEVFIVRRRTIRLLLLE